MYYNIYSYSIITFNYPYCNVYSQKNYLLLKPDFVNDAREFYLE